MAQETLISSPNTEIEDSGFQLINDDVSTLDTFRSYWNSQRGVELVFSISIIAVDMIFRFVAPTPRQRDLPYQYLESTGDYVVNQVNNEEFVGETVSNAELYLFGALIPFILQMLLSYSRGVQDIHKTLCVFAIAIGLTNILTNTIKVYVGYLRPIFFDVCQPDDTYQYCTSGEDNSARVSFPSGHSSLSFCGLALLAFYLESRIGLSKLYEWRLDPTSGELRQAQIRPVRYERILSILCYTPFLAAGFIATSRLVDNKHFPADVVGGSVLGTSVAKFIHGLWFSYD